MTLKLDFLEFNFCILHLLYTKCILKNVSFLLLVSIALLSVNGVQSLANVEVVCQINEAGVVELDVSNTHILL